MKQKFCVLICVHARKIRSSKNAALAFALLSQTFKKLFFTDLEVWKPHSG